MAIFNGHVITNEGRNLLGRALAGEGKIILTRAAMGDGKPSQDIRNLTALISEKMTANIADIFNDRGTVNLKVQITNSELEEAFKTEEFGIFAKIEGDKEEILYSYCNAVEADTIPSNSLGDIFVEEHTVYIAFSSDAEADIYIKEGAVFLTLETANKNYIQTGLKVEGKLSNGRTELHENCQYQGDDGKWYFNIGGDREWIAGTGTPDELLVEISYFKLYENLNKLSLEKFDKGTVPTALNSAEKVVAALQATTGLKFDPNKLYLNDPGINEEGFCYLDRLRDGIFKCLVRNEDGVNDLSKFEDISNKANSDRLDNLCQPSSVIKKEVVNGLTMLITDFGGYLQISLFASDITLKSDMNFQLGFTTKQRDVALHGFIIRGSTSDPNVTGAFYLYDNYIRCGHQVFARMLYYTINIAKTDIIV